jgi:hypothetical protein
METLKSKILNGTECKIEKRNTVYRFTAIKLETGLPVFTIQNSNLDLINRFYDSYTLKGVTID